MGRRYFAAVAMVIVLAACSSSSHKAGWEDVGSLPSTTPTTFSTSALRSIERYLIRNGATAEEARCIRRVAVEASVGVITTAFDQLAPRYRRRAVACVGSLGRLRELSSACGDHAIPTSPNVDIDRACSEMWFQSRD